MRLHKIRGGSPLLPLLGVAAGCAGLAPLTGAVMDAGRQMLLSTASQNFGDSYTTDFSQLIDVMLLKTVAGVGAQPATQPASQPPPAAAPAASPPLETAAQEEAIEISVSVSREVVLDGRPIPVAVQDGQILRDGVGRDGDGDNLKIHFEVNVPCYVYAVWVDATAWVSPVFPRSAAYEYTNPVEPGRGYDLPDGDNWFYLDDYRGVENLYFLASREPLFDLEQMLHGFVTRTRSFRSDVAVPATVEEPAELTRGLAGVRPGKDATIQSSDGSSYAVPSQLFASQMGVAEVVVWRWFRHE